MHLDGWRLILDVKYYYKEPGVSLWEQLETESLQDEIKADCIGRDWQYRFQDGNQEFTLDELLAKELKARTSSQSQANQGDSSSRSTSIPLAIAKSLVPSVPSTYSAPCEFCASV